MGTLRDAVTATAYWQRTKEMSVVCRLSGNTAASPEPGFLQAVIYQLPHPLRQRDDTATPHTAKAHASEKENTFFLSFFFLNILHNRGSLIYVPTVLKAIYA